MKFEQLKVKKVYICDARITLLVNHIQRRTLNTRIPKHCVKFIIYNYINIYEYNFNHECISTLSLACGS